MKYFILILFMGLSACETAKLSTLNLKVGDKYDKGTVFYIFQEGELGYVEGENHGFIVSDEEYTYIWGCKDVSQALFTDNGSENIDIIISYCGENTAAYYCYLLGWSLPSKKELQLLSNSNILSSTSYYWSSNKHSYTEAVAVRLFDGDLRAYPVYTVLKIRGIKEF